VLAIVHRPELAAVALAQGAQGVAGHDAAALVLLLRAVRYVAEDALGDAWVADAIDAWLDASEVLFPGPGWLTSCSMTKE
jgi:hypothetical protein